MMKHNKELLVGLGMAVWLILDFGEGIGGWILYLAIALPLSILGSYIQAKGMAWSVCYDCAQRHLMKFWYAREEDDQESSEHHLDHAICNLLFLKHYLSYYPDGDNRPPEGLFTTEDIDKLFDADAYCKRNDIDPNKEE